VPNVQVSDTTYDDRSNAAYYKNLIQPGIKIIVLYF